MRKVLLSVVWISLMSVAAAFLTWMLVGPPDRSVPCNAQELPKGQVCLSTVLEWDPGEVLWVDARPRDYWRRNGVEGSILVNDQEEWGSMEESFVLAVFGDGSQLKTKVVVYCNQAGCGSSEYVADRLRQKHSEALGFEVYVLSGGFKALANQL